MQINKKYSFSLQVEYDIIHLEIKFKTLKGGIMMKQKVSIKEHDK